jgi:hypothetical protein
MNWNHGKGLMVTAALAFVATVAAFAQSPELKEKLAAVKQSIAENQQRLHRYQWVETTQLTLKGDSKPPSQNQCRYGADGKVYKSPMGPPPQEPSGGRVKQRVIEKKKAEMQDYMGDVKRLLGMYVPPDPQKIEQAYQAGKVSLNPAGNIVNVAIKDYAQPGDQMVLTFSTAEKKVTGLSVNTYMGDTKDAVALKVQMASLPDGTNYAKQTDLTASAKQLQVITSNSNYQKTGGY